MENVLIAAEKHVVNLLNEQLKPSFLYHNLSHTQRVVKKVNELAAGIGLEEKTTQKLSLAAWFHDTGLIKSIENHEEEGVKIAIEFLRGQNVDESLIQEISDLILATKMEVTPKNDLEKIIRDADCAHIGSKNFAELTELLRKEWELTKSEVKTDSEWFDGNIHFLMNNHRFYTDFASKNWDKGKATNLAKMLKKQKKTAQESTKLKQKKEELSFKKSKTELPERGIETMFRVTLRNHITLSDIADTKANILLSVNAIIVSVALSNLLPKLDNPSNAHLIIPTIIFILFTIASMILSVFATRPNVTSGKFTEEDVKNKKVNLLFFGNFHKMKLDEFEWAMGEMMQDRDYLYSSMKKDLYFLGLVLNKKYKLLRTTYTVFMIGIIVSVIAFAVSFKINMGV
jgi:predicted metal-dependent HD superfamily phosphohydrolase